MNQIELRRQLGKVLRRVHRRVSAADDRHRFPRVGLPVAKLAVMDAAPFVASRLFERQLTPRHTRRQDYRAGFIDGAFRLHNLWLRGKRHAHDRIEFIDDGAEVLRLRLNGGNQFAAVNARQARIILNVRRIRDLSADKLGLQDQDGTSAASRIQSSRQSRHTCADYDHVHFSVFLRHCLTSFRKIKLCKIYFVI